MARNLLQLCFLWLLSNHICAQEIVASTNPTNIKWQKLKTENVSVLFPLGLENEAKRIAQVTNFIAEKKHESIGDKNYHLTILLHGRSMFPNAFVTTSPFRSEFFGTPIQDWSVMGPNNWIDLLAVHEYRHALQFSNADRGVTKLFHILSGQLGWNFSSNLSIPDWFWEGDATLSETLQTEAGRGRNPSFSEEQRALFAINKNYRYQVVRNGSFVKQLPSHYPLGYTMNLYARYKYGNEVWRDVVKDAGAYKKLIYPFSRSVKQYTGLHTRKLYKESFRWYQSRIDSLLALRNLDELTYLIAPEKKLVSNYIYPFVNSKGELYARKSTRKQTSQLVKFNDKGKWERIVDIGITSNAYVSYNDEMALWLENQANPRWANEDFSRLMSYNFETKSKRVVKQNTKAIFAAISPSGGKAAMVELDELQRYKLKIIDTESGDIERTLEIDENWAIAYPSFKGENKLFYLIKDDNKIALARHDISSDDVKILTPWMTQVVSELSVSEKYLYFRGGFDGVDNIYALPIEGGAIEKVTEVEVGAKTPFVLNDTLYFANSTYTGNYLVKKPLNESLFSPVEIVPLDENPVYSIVNSLEESESILQSLPDIPVSIENYKGAFKGWRLHSWGIDPVGLSTSGISGVKVNVEVDDFLEQNRLTPFLGYNFNENNMDVGLNYSFGKYFAIFNLGYNYRGREVQGLRNRVLNFQEQEIKAGLSVPLSFLTGNYAWRANTSLDVASIDFIAGSEENGFSNPQTSVYDVKWRLSSVRQRALQNVQPRWGFNISGQMAQSFLGAEAKVLRNNVEIFMPGVGLNHGIKLTYGIQNENFANAYQFQDTFDYPRGYPIGDNNGVRKVGVDYQLPLLYPDFGFGGLIYFKRLRSTLFYDYGTFLGNNIEVNTQSAGIELRFDNVYLNTLEIPIGFRVGYRVNDVFDFEPFFVGLLIGN